MKFIDESVEVQVGKPLDFPKIRLVTGHKQCAKASIADLLEVAAAAMTVLDGVGFEEVERVPASEGAEVVMARPNRAEGRSFISSWD